MQRKPRLELPSRPITHVTLSPLGCETIHANADHRTFKQLQDGHPLTCKDFSGPITVPETAPNGIRTPE
jgi:hypothetical protein